MRVIRVRAKVKKTYTDENLRQIYQCLANEYGKEIESFRNELIAAQQENERLRAELAVAKKKCSETSDLSMKAANDLAARLVKALDEVDAARAEAAELNVELMERQVRVDELERRIEWLLAHSNTEAEFVS